MLTTTIFLLVRIETVQSHRDAWLESGHGGVIYLVVTGIAIFMWLGFQLRNWFGWPERQEDNGPLTLGLNDSSHTRNESRHHDL